MQPMMMFFSLLSNPTGWLSSWHSTLAAGQPRFSRQRAPSLDCVLFRLITVSYEPACDKNAELDIIETSNAEKDWGRG